MTRLASCSFRGLPRAAQNRQRRRLLREISERLMEQQPPVDAMVLSGGYFVQPAKPNCYLDLSFKDRCGLLREAKFAQDLAEAAKTLDSRRPGALLIFGVDTDGPKNPMGDQLCVAWSAEGPVGIGRKVLPTESEGKCGFIINLDDYGTKKRVVSIGDTRVLLCACYDGYGISNQPDKSKYVSHISVAGNLVSKQDAEFRELLQFGLSKWRKLVGKANAAAVAIHQFRETSKGSFSTNYWRRHGIATASAKLGGGWVVAGANFQGRVPGPGADILATQVVPESYLQQGSGRKARDATPASDFVAADGAVRIRLFDFGAPAD